MPGSISFEEFLLTQARNIPLAAMPTLLPSLDDFEQHGLRLTEGARRFLGPCFQFTDDLDADAFREAAKERLLPMLAGFQVRGFTRTGFRWQYPDERPTLPRLQRILRTRGKRLLQPKELLHVLWLRPWQHPLFAHQAEQLSCVAVLEGEARDRVLLFHPLDAGRALLPYRVEMEHACCVEGFEPGVILFTDAGP